MAYLNHYDFHLTQDLKVLMDGKLLAKGYKGKVLKYKVPDFCKCGAYLSLDYHKSQQVGRDGYSDYILTCYGCGQIYQYKKYCKNDMPKHFIKIKDGK